MTRALSQARVCAIYTRKSSEEGLDQHFNSLDAQREACQAYVTSQTTKAGRSVAQLTTMVGFQAEHSIDRRCSDCSPKYGNIGCR